MDGSFGQRDMRLSLISGLTTGRLNRCFIFLFLVLLSEQTALATKENQPMHWSGDQTVWDRKRNVVELTGHATVTQPGETLVADHIRLDLNDRTLEARGNCIYSLEEAVIQGDEMYFNMDTRTGSTVRGRVTSEQFSLMGERINKLGPGRFTVLRGEYTTCRDCPNSWSLLGDDVDVQFEGYAYMKNVAVKIKDAPLLWFPYLIVPVKSRRQTGLLFPRFGTSSLNGFMYLQPFFWATGRSTDMTFGLGTYTSRGRRIEWEGRYALSPRSLGTAKVIDQQDQLFGAPRSNRWATHVEQIQELPFRFDEKMRFREVSDNVYPTDFQDDIVGMGDSTLSSDLIFSRAGKDVSSYIALRRYRNLLNTQSNVDFDAETVQQYPYALITTNDQRLWDSPVAMGLSLGIANFTRANGAQDYDLDSTSKPGDPFKPGIDPIRKATRVSMTPSIYTTLNPGGVFSVVPSMQYRGYFYNFPNDIPSLNRGYVIFQTDISTQFERIYDTDDPDMPKIKHLIRPTLTYSRIPYISQKEHPFIQQTEYRGGYKFDNYDIVPIDNSPSTVNYFTPLGHSISYGAVTQVISRHGRLGQESNSYQRNVEFAVGQTFNIRELEKPEDQRVPLTRLFSTLNLDFTRFSASANYYYYPYLGRLISSRPVASRPTWSVSPHEGSTTWTYYLERTLHQRILTFERSFNMSYSYSRIDSNVSNAQGMFVYSLNDYIMPAVGSSYDFLTHSFFTANLNLTFQSPSQCWRFVASLSHYLGRPGVEVRFDFSLNLTGESFGGVSDVASGHGGTVPSLPVEDSGTTNKSGT